MKPKKSASLELLKLCCRVLEEKKTGDLRVLDVSGQSSITDYLVLGTATSEPHLRALRVELEKALDAAKAHIVGMESAQESGWMVVDVFDVMIHLFLSEARERYGLERLWKDAKDVSVSKLLAVPSAKVRAGKKLSKAGAKRSSVRSVKRAK